MDAGDIIAVIVGVVAFIGQLFGMWRWVSSELDKIDQQRQSDKSELVKKIAREHEANASQEKDLALIKQAHKINGEVWVQKLDEIGGKVDDLRGRHQTLERKLDHHMAHEAESMRKVVREELEAYRRPQSRPDTRSPTDAG